jgi:hypothetical protein
MTYPASKKTKRFRINPLEVGVFSLVAFILCNSVYSLFQDDQGFKLAALTPMATGPTSTHANRAPASVSKPLDSFEAGCGAQIGYETSASKLRIIGQLCGRPEGAKPHPSLKIKLKNLTNQFNATVFTDTPNNKFSTDYIPLDSGKNLIQATFHYGSGNQATQEITVNKQ